MSDNLPQELLIESDNLPSEILIDILIRVPVKSLVCFTLVSKSWHALITSPSFITAHLNRIQHQNDLTSLMLLRRYTSDDLKEHYSLLADEEILSDEDDNGDNSFALKSTELRFPVKTGIGYCRIVGSCNGLVCLSHDLFGTTKHITLWNPSIQKHVTSPLPTINPPLPYMFVLGFGVDSRQDYKVVRIVYHREKDFDYELPAEVEVYTLSLGFWRRITSAGLRFYVEDFIWSQAFVNAAVHWIAYQPREKINGGSFCSLIIAFSMDNEKFNEIMLPDALANELARNLTIKTYKDSLAVIKYERGLVNSSCTVWVMKEYGVVESWTRMYSIDLVGKRDRVVGFRKNGHILVSRESGELATYDPKTCATKKRGIFGSFRAFYADSFLQTLVLLERQNVVAEEE
ncbi:hypothetical protein M9H77_20094 [Catharanthus roseus]|uniref:Uncharacterized protein n=1 Tax=Catharanthus roseus TaxID=4058 RepID=A0ACC0AJJ0_CATRO|nr:hypothetical protein M9H77_20094 [Catharanthus roseus]